MNVEKNIFCTLSAQEANALSESAEILTSIDNVMDDNDKEIIETNHSQYDDFDRDELKAALSLLTALARLDQFGLS